MWPVVIVFASPVLDDDSGFEEVGEVLDVEAFVAIDTCFDQRGNPLEPTQFCLRRCSDLSPRPTIVCGRNQRKCEIPPSKCGVVKGPP